MAAFYVHYPSDGGDPTTVYVEPNGDRWHYVHGDDGRKLILPKLPTIDAGRYALDFYDLSTRRGYRRFHDDYMLKARPEITFWSWKERSIGPRVTARRIRLARVEAERRMLLSR